MTSNNSGSYKSLRQNRMAAFDKLPPTARAALASALFSWAPQPFLTAWKRGYAGYKTGGEIAEVINRFDKEQAVKDRKTVWGIDDKTGEVAGPAVKKKRRTGLRPSRGVRP